MKGQVGGVTFFQGTLEEATAAVLAAAGSRETATFRLSNAFCVVIANDDPAYRDVLNGPGLTFPDGSPVAWLLNMRYQEQAGRVRGASLFRSVLAAGTPSGLRHYFLGTTETTLKMLCDEIVESFPGVKIVGTYAPPFGEVADFDVDDFATRIRKSDADVVWIGMGTPKQDYLAQMLSLRAGVPCVGVGAAFDFEANVVREAPTWMQRLGLEWVHRFAQDPRRLWKRYLIGNIRFVLIVMHETIRHRLLFRRRSDGGPGSKPTRRRR